MSSFGKAIVVSTVSIMLGACGGDIVIAPKTTDASTDNSQNTGGNTTTAVSDVRCASYTNSDGQKIEGSVEGSNCVYAPSFVDAGNNLTVDLTIPALGDGGAHIFEGSLFVGENHDSDAELAAAGIAEGGDGPKLTIEPGATLAWRDNTRFVIINRGAQLFAVGTQDKPITFTSVSDIEATVGPEDVQQWGGIVINGFGVTNKCDYSGSVGGTLTTSDCHVASEGAEGLDESHYGGANNDDSSGRLEYVRVKHTGAEVANGDELNGITFGAVGRNTIVKNLQVYSTYDDGIEMFGGAVNFENYVALYVRDDSIDIDEGYRGTITNALVIQQETDGNRCIEADGIGSYSNKTEAFIQDMFARGLNSRPTINGLTCIVSPSTGTHDPGSGWRLREGIWPTISNALVVSSFGAPTEGDDNWCIRVDDTVASEGFAKGNASISSTVFACETKSAKSIAGMSVHDWLTTNGGNVFVDVSGVVDATANADTGVQLLEGTPPIYSINANTSVPSVTPTAVCGGGQAACAFVGGVNQGSNDWTAGWTYGIHEDSRAQPLWFE